MPHSDSSPILSSPSDYMMRAIDLAKEGEGFVEPNPMVGCVLVHEGVVVGEGYHQQFGGPHAEVHALAMAGEQAKGATAYVTLEPCSHTGKTPPCAEALIHAGITKVVIACEDPNPQVNGKGIARLREAGIECLVGDGKQQAEALLAPFRKLMLTGSPWVIAKWAMSQDGKMATPPGESPWISSEASQKIVHQIRGRVDGVLVGAGTLLADDPLLNARPAGPRIAMRIVLADDRPLPLDRKLFQSASEANAGQVLLAVGPNYPTNLAKQHEAMDVGVWQYAASTNQSPAAQLLEELGRRKLTNLLVEGGSKLLEAWFDEKLIDEVHTFIAPKTIGGEMPSGPAGGLSVEEISKDLNLTSVKVTKSGDDVYLLGRVRRDAI